MKNVDLILEYFFVSHNNSNVNEKNLANNNTILKRAG